MSKVSGPEPMWLDATAAEPGQTVLVHFQPGSMRGLAYTLSVLVADRWEDRYLVTSDANGDEPLWWTAQEGEDVFVHAVGVESYQPDTVVIPPSAPPGKYRLCASRGQGAYAHITIDPARH